MHILIVIIIAVSIFSLSVFTPLEYDEWILYVFPQLYAFAHLKRQHFIILAAVCLMLIILDFFISPQRAITPAILVNRLIGLVTIMGTSFLFIQLKLSLEKTKEMEQEMRHQAHHDALTGLPNRRLFADLIRIKCAEALRHRTKIALLFMDLDRFKDVNDTLGHEVGDLLLKEVAARLKANLRKSDIIFRTGGDEFNIIISDISKVENISDVAQNIVGIFQRPFSIAGHELHITTSIGISIYPDDSDDIEMLLRYADIAMYYAKECATNMFQFYDHQINRKNAT
ncbi:MAG: GGDEF domain-containing protein [Nitrospirae bacterium]|nr:GGDEF domain-containing protein [Nitrospirota bacterium]